MSNAGEVVWGGGYAFAVYDPTATTWNDVPGVYVFAGLDATERWWYAKYIGQTTSFKSRIPSHERWQEAVRQGATHVHARVVQDASQRIDLENALVEAYRPPMNHLPV